MKTMSAMSPVRSVVRRTASARVNREIARKVMGIIIPTIRGNSGLRKAPNPFDLGILTDVNG